MQLAALGTRGNVTRAGLHTSPAPSHFCPPPSLLSPCFWWYLPGTPAGNTPNSSFGSDSSLCNTREGSSSGPPPRHLFSAEPSPPPTVLGLLKITSGEGFYRQRAGGRGERRQIGCLCVPPDSEGMLDVDSPILPASLCHGCVQSEGELYI